MKKTDYIKAITNIKKYYSDALIEEELLIKPIEFANCLSIAFDINRNDILNDIESDEVIDGELNTPKKINAFVDTLEINNVRYSKVICSAKIPAQLCYTNCDFSFRKHNLDCCEEHPHFKELSEKMGNCNTNAHYYKSEEIVDVDDFSNYSVNDYKECLKELNIKKFSDLVGKKVYYVKINYGIHKVIKWDRIKANYLLELDGQKFWSSPFQIFYLLGTIKTN